VLLVLHDALRAVYGARIQMEPKDHADYSCGYRPDLAMHGLAKDGGMLIGDTKVFDSIGADASKVAPRGAAVAFGNTLPAARLKVLGRTQRGTPDDGRFDPITGQGYVSAAAGDYAHSLSVGATVLPLLFETFGGFGPDTCRLLGDAAKAMDNKMQRYMYDEASWSTRSWHSFWAQRISVALHCAVAWEIGTEYGLPVGAGDDPRDYEQDRARAAVGGKGGG
jgi:hypothetical protein